jgi:hypothetical protein
MEAFKDRVSPGPLRPLAGVAGFVYIACGAWAHASLESGTGFLNNVLSSHVATAIGTLLGIDLIYRIPRMMAEAAKEAQKTDGA